MQYELDVARKLACEAAAAIIRHYQRGSAVEFKDARGNDPVTAADREANAIIVEGLAAAFPDDAILAEESPLASSRHAARRLWCVDPLDGTREFVDHNGEFSVMIGLAVDGEARLGVVCRPAAEALYWGVGTEAGALIQGTASRLRVSEIADPREARLVVSRSHRSKAVSAVASRLGIAQERPLGSVGLKAVEVAGRDADLYISLSNMTHEWDACAPEAIVRAAGGTVTDIVGDRLRYNKPTTPTPRGILMTNGPLLGACLRALRPIALERGWIVDVAGPRRVD